MEKTRQVANFCVGRAVLFGWLAIGCIMLSFSFNPVIAFKAGAVLALVMSSILLVKAFGASRKPARKTEVWLYLDKSTRPMNDEAQRIFRDMMREVYARFAQTALVMACFLFMLSIVFMGIGFEPSLPVPERITTQG
jgi:multidrug efflux pump subunit AcrB